MDKSPNQRTDSYESIFRRGCFQVLLFGGSLSLAAQSLNHFLVKMETSALRLSKLCLLLQIAVALFSTHVCVQGIVPSVLVDAKNVTVRAGSKVVLPCYNQKIVWRQDNLQDRQRVVHWDLNRNRPDYSVERVLDMFSGGTQRVYNANNKGRITISEKAFSDGNFSLTIHNVDVNDKGIYTCNLHHHYCNIDQSIQVQLNVTKSARKEKRVWDGDKAVFVVLAGSSVVLPCVNRRSLWRERNWEEGQQQVVHWDFQGPGVRRDQAERLMDLYASGEKRENGPLSLRSKIHISDNAFSEGDFSLTIDNIQPSNKGLYSCHLHHHYCGLNERRTFRVIVGPSMPTAADTTVTPSSQPVTQRVKPPQENPDDNTVEASHVVNVILPESQNHLMYQASYILGLFLLLLLILIVIIMTTQHCKKKGLDYDLRRDIGYQNTEIELQPTELRTYNQEDLRLDYKNNIMKEMNNYRTPKEIDLNKEMEKFSQK